MKSKIVYAIGVLVTIGSVVLACYLGGWLLIVKPCEVFLEELRLCTAGILDFAKVCALGMAGLIVWGTIMMFGIFVGNILASVSRDMEDKR